MRKAKRYAKPRTIKDIVLDRYPHFDPNKHSILLNGKPVCANELEWRAGLCDIVKLAEKANQRP
jgi:hypothetical protein